MGLQSDCKTLFKTTDLYEVLGCFRTAGEKEVKRAYYKTSLLVHPDRVESSEKENATLKFQILGKVFSILSDTEKRAVYDETGEIDEENIDQEKNWDQYWRILFKKISVSDIKNFEEKYKGSDEELEDLKQAYVMGAGDMGYILENVLCATIDDEERFEKILSQWIEEKKIKKLPRFSSTSREKESRKRKAAKEAQEAEEMKKELGLDDSEASLKQLIQKKAQSRGAEMDSFFDNLAAKYGKEGKKKSKSKK